MRHASRARLNAMARHYLATEEDDDRKDLVERIQTGRSIHDAPRFASLVERRRPGAVRELMERLDKHIADAFKHGT